MNFIEASQRLYDGSAQYAYHPNFDHSVRIIYTKLYLEVFVNGIFVCKFLPEIPLILSDEWEIGDE